ncbi:DUF4132 domain-containing protein [Hydrogenophaga sp.]|uniref:DUF4132 domain-containing protein n=1 Tax=Hydrogenophaga sp. TaxID=1904254 RepID=UPI00271CFB8C|nr:DUF4132 domain-containing protein [Hydrogenophaga sp.]MDO9436655.1 DUF4132 domain-containing protein [Hydrogenophaga sp.]
MRRFEAQERTKTYFWEIWLVDNVVTERGGRVGKGGQVAIYAMKNSRTAQHAHDGYIRQKILQGFHEVALAEADKEPPPSQPAPREKSSASRLPAPVAPVRTASLPVCAPEQLPPLLREPPWLSKARAVELPTLNIPIRAWPDRIEWTDKERAWHASYRVDPMRLKRGPTPTARALIEMCIVPEGAERVMAGLPVRDDDIQVIQYFRGTSPEVVLLFESAAAIALWNSYPSKFWFNCDGNGPVEAILALHGEAALPGLLGYAEHYPLDVLAMAPGVDCAALVPLALRASHRLKKGKASAMTWLRRHAPTALVVSLPLAFGPDKALREDAQFGLRWLMDDGFDAQARAIATVLGPEVAQALQALLDVDPLRVLPPRIPKLPAYFVASSFSQPVLREGGAALPDSAIEHIGTMLAISPLDAPYPGLAIVKALCTPQSLAALARDLFEAWMVEGAPSKAGWFLTALGWLGDDEAARRLAPCIREWPGQAAHQRAVAGLDVLAAIGSDVALMHLHGIATKVKFKALQEKAQEKIAAIAEARGLTPLELADRLVPDLGLDEKGTLPLDFGPRQFVVGFDEALKPIVKDAQGVRLKDLPKALKGDDAEMAEAATVRFKQLKKDAKAIARLQVLRLEASMVARRRWAAADFKLFFLEHPLMRHMATRLVWGVYGAQGALVSGFRVAEDGTLADADDVLTTLDDQMQIGIAHVLEMPPTLQAAFGQVLADYEIVQPFRQLSRETHAMTPDELQGRNITRFGNRTVEIGSLMGLVNRGWTRGEAEDGGWFSTFTKTVEDGLEVQIEIDPGAVLGDLNEEPEQRITGIVLRRVGDWDLQHPAHYGQLHPITVSELLRDVEWLPSV